jgi:hypothetical protein
MASLPCEPSPTMRLAKANGPTPNGPAIDRTYDAEGDPLGAGSIPAVTEAGDRPFATGHEAIEEPPSTGSTGTGGAE